MEAKEFVSNQCEKDLKNWKGSRNLTPDEWYRLMKDFAEEHAKDEFRIYLETVDSMAKDLSKCRIKKRKLTEAYQEYITLLGKEIDELVPLIAMKGWKSKRYEAGINARQKIDSLLKQK